MADKVLWYKYVTKNTAKKHGKTVTFMPKPIFQDNGSGMHTHQSLWKDGKNLFYQKGGYADISQTCKYYIGGHPEARAGAVRPDRALDQLVPPPGAGLRGADQPRLHRAQPLGGRAHPDVLELGEGQAPRVPHARPDLQPVPVLLGLPDGRARRHPEQDRPGRAARQGPLRAAGRGGGEGEAAAGLARRGARQPREGPRVPAEGRRLHAGPDRDLDRVQAQDRRSTPFACGRIPGSSRSTSTSERGAAPGVREPVAPRGTIAP